MGLTHNISRGISSSLLKLSPEVAVAAQQRSHKNGRFRYIFHMFMGCGNSYFELGCGYGSLTATTSAHHGKSYEAATYTCISGCLRSLGNCMDLLLGACRPLLIGQGILSAKNGDFRVADGLSPHFFEFPGNQDFAPWFCANRALCSLPG